MEPKSFIIFRICLLISATLLLLPPLASPAFVFEVKLDHYQNVERLLFDGKTRCGASIDFPCEVSVEFCLLTKPEGLSENDRIALWANNLPSSAGSLPCLVRKKTASPLDRLLGRSDKEGADRNLYFIEGAILNEKPKMENPVKFDFEAPITNKDLMMIVIVYHKNDNVMDVFSWNSPATGLPLQQASMNPLDGDPGGWMDDTLVNLQTTKGIENSHPSKFKVKVRNLCAPNYFDAPNGCDVLCAPKPDSKYDCDTLTGAKVCREGYINPLEECGELKNKCDSSPCTNGGTCVQDKTDSRGFVCNCIKGFKGPNCEIEIDECSEITEGKPDDAIKCLNGGSCVDRVGRFDCECTSGFLGPRCNSSGPCFNYCSGSGSCVLINQAATICNSINCNCSCRPGFKGARCEENVNECESNPCNSEHATCRDTIGSFECICKDGFAGETCNDDLDECRFQNCIQEKCSNQIQGANLTIRESSIDTCIIQYIDECWHPDPRVRTPCNGGQCKNKRIGEVFSLGNKVIDENQGYFCVCPEGYKGSSCSSLSTSECEDRSVDRPVCQNGGTCINVLGDFFCECREEFRGKTCGERRTVGPREAGEPYAGVPIFTLIIILATIYTLAFVMAMAWVIWLWMRRENSKTDIFFAIPNPPVSRSNSYKQVPVY